MKKKKEMRDCLFAWGFVGLLFALSLWNVFLPQKVFSQTENRNLKTYPEFHISRLLSGEWMKDFESYATDQFPGRDWFMQLKTKGDLALGKKDNGKVYFGKDDYLIAINEFDPIRQEKNTVRVTDFFKSLKQLPEKIDTSILLVPSVSEVRPQLLPKYAPKADEEAMIQKIYEAVGAADPQAVKINPILDLRREEKKQVYYRTDHHWTSHGAYLAYRAWAGEKGLKPLEEEEFQVSVVTESFYGTNQAKTSLNTLKPDSIESYAPKDARSYERTVMEPGKAPVKETGLYDESFLGKKDKYAYFLGGNHSLMTIDTPVSNGKTLLLIKDSYANALVPFLANHYERLVLVDLRYYKSGLLPVISEYHVTEVLVLYSLVQFSEDQNLAYLRLQ